MPGVYEFLEAEGIVQTVTANHLQIRLATCSSARSGDLRTRCVGSMPISLSGGKLDEAAPGDRQGRVASGRALSARRLHRHQHGATRQKSSRSTINAALASNGSRKARARSNGRGCHAGRSPPTPSGFSFMRWPTISAISCARWRCPRRSKTVSDEPEGEADQDRREGGLPRSLRPFQMAEVAIPRQMFQEILRLIAELRPRPPPAPA